MVTLARDIADELKKMADQYPVVTVLGPRQSGKSTLVKTCFTNKPYVSLENLDERGLAEMDPIAFLERYSDGVVLDEIQRVPQLLSYIQGIVDKNEKKGFYILTGRHQLALHESISQSLAGRTAILKLLPLSIHELTQKKIALTLDEYILHGMYPRIYKDNLNPTKFYRDYIQTYVERDVRQMINIKDLLLFQHFLKLCAGRIGQVFNSHNLANEVGVSHNTINRWLSVLEASFLIFRLKPYFENFGKRIIKSPKIYFTDVGLATWLLDIYTVEQVARDPLRGHLVENFIVSEFFKNQLNKGIEPNFYYYRDSNLNEIDLIYKTGNQLIPIEIKAARSFHPDFLKGLKYFNQLVGDRMPTGMVIYAGDQEQRIQDYQLCNFKNIHKILNNV